MKKEIISKKTLEYLAELARIELKPEKEEKLLKDLEKILEYFEELKKVNVENIEPMAGGANLKNVFREDESNVKCQMSDVKLMDAFPEKEGGYLKVPEVFE
ncbi:MAG: Asp-tRNA(Asn)/Glu-tRNA(Gln) amidotransferase subunit GatC [Patescibacteria group bacterium]